MLPMQVLEQFRASMAKTRIIEKPKGTRIFGTPEMLNDPNVHSVKTILDEASLGG